MEDYSFINVSKDKIKTINILKAECDAGILECQKISQTNIYINTKLMELLKV